MATTQAQWNTLHAMDVATNAAWAAFQAAWAGIGIPPTLADVDALQEALTAHPAGIASYIQATTNPPAWYAYVIGNPTSAPGKAYQAWWQDVAAEQAYYQEIHPEGINWLGIAPALLGAAVSGYLAATEATVGTAAATTSTTTTGAAAVGTGATTEELAAGAGAVTTPIVISGSGAATAAGTTASVAASAAQATSGTASSTVGNAVSSLTGSSTLGDIASSLTSGIGDLITDFKTIFGPVVSFAQTVLTDVDNIDKNYIVPFTTAISKDYTTISGLITEVHDLSQSGIQGILAIPSAISSALTSVDAANQRLVQMTTQANQGIATDTLVPGIGTAIATPVAKMGTILQGVFQPEVPDVGKLSVEPLSEADFAGFDPSQSQADAIQQLRGVPVFGAVLVAVLGIWKDILQFIGYLESWISFSRQAGRLAQPIEPIGIGETIKAWWRGQMTPDDALEEIKRQGIEPTRAQLLYDLEQWLPGIADAMRMYYRGVLSADQVATVLGKQGLSAADIQALTEAALTPVDPREAIQLNGRVAAAQAGFVQQTLTGVVPDEYQQLYFTNNLQGTRATLDWTAHWNIGDIHWWATAYFRGLASADEFKLAAQAFNFAPELVNNLIAVEQETIQLWMIPDMIASGLFTQDQAMSYLQYIGIAPRDAALIYQYGAMKANQGAATDALQLGQLSIGVAAAMYRDGIINSDEYTDILTAHKMSPAAAALTIKLEDQVNAVAQRRENAKGLVKQVDVGLLSLSAMQSQMYSQGYTQQEVDNYTADAQTNAITKAKFPTEAQIKDFLTAGILDTADALQALQVAGWSPTWAQAFITLWSGSNGTTSNSG